VDQNSDRIAERIRRRREELGLTQREMARLLGVSKSTPGAWESGRANVREVLLGRIAEVLQTSEEWLRSGQQAAGRRSVSPQGRLRPDEQLLLVAYNALPSQLRRVLINWAEVVGEALKRAPERQPALAPALPVAPPPPVETPSAPARHLQVVGTRAPRPHLPSDEHSLLDANDEHDEHDELADVVPLRNLGDIAAGLPAQAWRQGDEVLVPRAALDGLRAGLRAGVLRVSGDSMEPTITKGSLILVREATLGQYHKGDVVVALIDGEETTLKRYAGQRRGVITLRADNPAYEDQHFEPGRVVVQAVMLEDLGEAGSVSFEPQPL
jgi:SOS-response transcriptional repressor LexA